MKPGAVQRATLVGVQHCDRGPAVPTVLEVMPSPPLREFVRSYHHMTIDPGGASLSKPITARPEQMMQFSLQQPFTMVDRRSGSMATAPGAVVVGRQTRRNLDLVATGMVTTLTIHFQPAGFHRLFHMPMHHVTDLAPDAIDVVGPGVRVLHDRLAESGDVATMIGHVEHFLRTRVDSSRPFHPVQAAAKSMLSGQFVTDIRTMAEASQLSVRQFERAFLEQVGTGPKLFARVVRFAEAIQSKYDHPGRTWADVAAHAGYFDQTHLVRDCHSFGSDTPTALMKTWVDCSP